ncbi:ABC transporter ATP-binding protein [Candidatus Woesearchaeota archaeon]|nr:ABC transporter ATP-binding protein [Candidatus Woesearchaeota archaeon]
MGKEVVLRAKGVRKEFNQRVVLDNVSLEIERGEIFGIIGISGCGKTTLLHTFVGFYEAEEGELFISQEGKEQSLHADLSLARKSFGFAPQHPSFYPKLTVQENLEHFGILYGLEEEELDPQIDELMQLTKLDKAAESLAEQLSYGMQKRLGIACALVHNPSILLLDEPTADLDPIMRKEIWKLVKRINSRGTTIVIASHLLGEVEEMCDRIGMLHKGKLVYVGSFSDMKQKYEPRQEVTIRTMSHLYDAIIARLKPIDVNPSADMLHILTTDPEKTVNAIVRHINDMGDKIEYLHVAPPSLEELFTLIEEERR